MSKAEEVIAKVAQRLEELSIDLDSEELEALSEELGKITFSEPKGCGQRCRSNEQAAKMLQSMFYSACREGVIDPQEVLYDTHRSRDRMDAAMRVRYMQPTMALDPRAFARISGT